MNIVLAILAGIVAGLVAGAVAGILMAGRLLGPQLAATVGSGYGLLAGTATAVVGALGYVILRLL